MHENKNIIVTGFSGAGISSVLKTLEDLGHEVFDNFPLHLGHYLLENQQSVRPIALGIDTRTRGFDATEIIDFARTHDFEILFITCEPREIQKRFSETRRRHPLAESKSVKSGIEQEQKLLEPLEGAADTIIDTSGFSVHDLRHMLEGHFLDGNPKSLNITLMSFGFKHGAPREADIMMDVRFLKNPHWDPDLKPLTGKDQKIGAFIAEDEDYKSFMENFKALIYPLLPRYKQEGKTYLTIAVGCTGGRHRSVHIVETLNIWLKGEGLSPHIDHRDLKD